jgi:cold-inducible RNA-binding protein
LRNCLYVGNLGSSDHRDLEDLLSRFGVVRYAALVAGEATAGAGPFGVVEMQSEDDARSAIRALSGFEIRGAFLIVRWATPPEQTACGHPAMFGSMNLCNGVNGDDAPPTPEPPITAGGHVGAAINDSTADSANPFPCEDLWREHATTSKSSNVEIRSRKDGG